MFLFPGTAVCKGAIEMVTSEVTLMTGPWTLNTPHSYLNFWKPVEAFISCIITLQNVTM